jgi:DNA-binding winged helix-turn-helix (wHTH) protein
MGLLKRQRSSASARERGQMRRRLREIEDERHRLLNELGGLALEMHRRERFEQHLLDERAVEIEALDQEARLLRRGLEQKLTTGQVQALESDPKLGSPAGPQPQ